MERIVYHHTAFKNKSKKYGNRVVEQTVVKLSKNFRQRYAKIGNEWHMYNCSTRVLIVRNTCRISTGS